MDVFTQLAEERIKKAIEDGDFDHMQGKGKPQQLDDLSNVPDDMRMGYRIMKNSGFLPEEVKLNQQLFSIREALKACEDPEEERRLTKRLSEKELEFQLMLEKRNIKKSPAYKKYRHKMQQLF
ncbi:hypothetical protein J416_15292 [Gracilibacillus halophilus YIM-C55.5]|uniref:DnaJ homologue subfamily C member 28 conserved domain-containing protein n=1 Tax=Gracilibacillus halophilus YIM-C55.5 TaxID=1308866 RepID=N4WHE8_9BACI|nr:DUF1992 domain-containing protein [Gracilibacillus halophilus]ENH95602.1 hypothetical protein J416_15292 [Gracilibacillus halophilus YIM-C55.5]